VGVWNYPSVREFQVRTIVPFDTDKEFIDVGGRLYKEHVRIDRHRASVTVKVELHEVCTLFKADIDIGGTIEDGRTTITHHNTALARYHVAKRHVPAFLLVATDLENGNLVYAYALLVNGEEKRDKVARTYPMRVHSPVSIPLAEILLGKTSVERDWA
jgi:uncharacterized beta-barrel protein YwiB (DUF1934 family)